MRNKHRNNGNDRAPYHWEFFNTSYNDGDKNRKKYLDFIKPLNKQFLLTGHKARGQQHSDIILFKGMNEGMSSKQLTNSDILRWTLWSRQIFFKFKIPKRPPFLEILLLLLCHFLLAAVAVGSVVNANALSKSCGQPDRVVHRTALSTAGFS